MPGRNGRGPVMGRDPRITHPGWLRVTHWFNAVAVVLMVTSGWRIYNATRFFDFDIPSTITLGGWLGGALQWHFAAMWLLFANGMLYLSINLFSGRLQRQFFPVTPRQLLRDLGAALKGKLLHAEPGHYNSVQRLAYLFVMVDSLALVLSGLVLWKSVQFPMLRELMGGYEAARRVHFFAMSGLCAFIVVHVVMVALVPRTLLTMLRGR
ncbi:cytochrome b/b6 domain-containing protein [Undibacterium sp. TJN25]|uniref:cytochrome b/b6 domain-containing protein n=1 Tax=Undibacterium sp. TJN25 TaxID=3413056 RepID=UPI003BF08FF6